MYQILDRRWGRSGNDKYTKLLLHCNGDDGSTSFRDDSRSDYTITANGNAQLDTAQKKFGKSSALFDGTGDYLSIPDSDGLNMGSGNFTIDFWVRFNELPIADSQGFFQHYQDEENWIILYITEGAGIQYLRMHISKNGQVVMIMIREWSTVALNTWYHIAFIRGWDGNPNDWAITVDGTKLGDTEIDSTSWPTSTGIFYIGYLTGLKYLNGWLDEFRVSKGIARWTANFTPPPAPYR